MSNFINTVDLLAASPVMLHATTETEKQKLKRVHMSKTLTARRWLLHDIIPPTITTLAADKGVGKSWTAVTLALQTAFPEAGVIKGIAPTPRRKVIWNLENGQSQLDNMMPGLLHEYGITREKLDEWIIVFNADGRDPESWAEAVREEIDSDPDTYMHEGLPPLILVDTLSASFNSEENGSNEAAATLASITKHLTFPVGDVEECPVCLVGHTVKDNGGRGASMRGSGAWEGNATHNLQLRLADPKDKSSPRVLIITKNRMGEQDTIAMVTYLHDMHEQTLPCTYGQTDAKGQILTIPTKFMIIKGATREAAEEMGIQLGRSRKANAEDSILLGLRSLLPFEGSNNALATCWRELEDETKRNPWKTRAVLNHISRLKDEGLLTYQDGVFEWVGDEDEPL